MFPTCQSFYPVFWMSFHVFIHVLINSFPHNSTPFRECPLNRQVDGSIHEFRATERHHSLQKSHLQVLLTFREAIRVERLLSKLTVRYDALFPSSMWFWFNSS